MWSHNRGFNMQCRVLHGSVCPSVLDTLCFVPEAVAC
jgi:hypothetical protein